VGREIIENNPLIVAEDLSIDSHFWAMVQQIKTKESCLF